MTALREKPSPGDLQPGAAIVFEFGNILFFGVIDDASMLTRADRLKVTFYHASVSKVWPYLPAQLWLRAFPVTSGLRGCVSLTPRNGCWRRQQRRRRGRPPCQSWGRAGSSLPWSCSFRIPYFSIR